MNIVRYRRALSICLLLMTIGSCSEPTELPIIHGNFGKRRKRRDTAFLDRVPENRRDEVNALLEDTELSLKEKCDALLNLLDPEAPVMEEVLTYLNQNPCSPFLFLIGIDDQTVKIIHGVILCQQENKHKNEVIQLMLKGNKLQEEMYSRWKMNLVRDVPREILNLLPREIEEEVMSLVPAREYSKAIHVSSKASLEACQALQEWVNAGTSRDLEVWHQFLFSNAQKILQGWIETPSPEGFHGDSVKTETASSVSDFVLHHGNEALAEETEELPEEVSQTTNLWPNGGNTDVVRDLMSFSEKSEDNAEQNCESEEPEGSSLHSPESPEEQSVGLGEELNDQADLSIVNLPFVLPERTAEKSSTTFAGQGSPLPPVNISNSCDEDIASLISKNYAKRHGTSPPVNALNILLFGSTGVGKTTFINGFGNYLRFSTLEEALQGDAEIRADASFTVTEDKTYECRQVTVRANTGLNLDDRRGNERLNNDGQSSTHSPMEHIFEFYEGGEKKLLRIIDTPGILDTRGQAQDRRNTGKIFQFIRQFGEIHAICILMKPNEAKFTLEFRQGLDQLFRELNQSSIKNILFCFTNCRTTQYRPGESFPILRKYLEHLRAETGIVIKADRHNILCFDNDCFRYLCAVKTIPAMYSPELNRVFAEGWKINVKETARLLWKAKGLTAHSVEDSVAVHRARTLLPELSRLIVEHCVNQFKLMWQIEESIKEIELYEGAAQNWEEKLIYEQVETKSIALNRPRTVCTSAGCVVYEPISDTELQPVAIKACCMECDVPLKDVQDVPENIKRCKTFTESGMCVNCNCSWDKHIQITSELRRIKTQKPDYDALGRWRKCETAREAKELVLTELEQKKKQLLMENEKITDFVAECSVFLSKNAIKTEKDSYVSHLNCLIEDEVRKYECGSKNMVLAYDLAGMLDTYDAKVKQIEEGSRNALSNTEVEEHLDELKTLKLSGSAIDQIASYLHM